MHPCGAGTAIVAIDTNGNIYPCRGFLGTDYKIGHVNNGINRDKQQELVKYKTFNIIENTKCQECWAQSFCMGAGSCIATNYLLNSDMTILDDLHCEKFRDLLKLRIATLSELMDKKPDVAMEIIDKKK